MAKFSDAELAALSSQTIQHYEESAAAFWQGTKDHDVSQNYEAFLSSLPAGQSLKILDLGCGPGRDVASFKKLGHSPTGLDGSRSFCRMTATATGCSTLNQDFLKLDLPAASFDGVFANASLFHVPSQELIRVLGELKAALVPEGILFSSNPRGSGEGWNGSRYGHYLEFEPYQALLQEAGFTVLNHYYRPAGKPREEQPWLAVVSRAKRG